MQNQLKPVLIFAQSGRFLAQSATQAGYRAWVADCFGDQETRSFAERWQQLAPLSELSADDVLNIFSKLTQGEECMLICGSGIESLFSILDELPDNIRLIGNSFETLHTLKTPQLFFETLNKLQLPYPDTVFSPPTDNNQWLVKSASGLGGQHIQYLNKSTPVIDQYFQRYIDGLSGSVLLLANGKQAQMMSINQQILATNQHQPFQLGSIETPWLISDHHRHALNSAISKITLETSLLGLNSLDFIISAQDELLLLEVNPRPSASAELIHNQATLFQHHMNACRGLLPSSPLTQVPERRSLHYIYARHDVMIPDDMSWPLECHDRPNSGTLILRGEPICTLLIRLKEHHQADHSHSFIEGKISHQLLDLP